MVSHLFYDQLALLAIIWLCNFAGILAVIFALLFA